MSWNGLLVFVVYTESHRINTKRQKGLKDLKKSTSKNSVTWGTASKKQNTHQIPHLKYQNSLFLPRRLLNIFFSQHFPGLPFELVHRVLHLRRGRGETAGLGQGPPLRGLLRGRRAGHRAAVPRVHIPGVK